MVSVSLYTQFYHQIKINNFKNFIYIMLAMFQKYYTWVGVSMSYILTRNDQNCTVISINLKNDMKKLKYNPYN